MSINQTGSKSPNLASNWFKFEQNGSSIRAKRRTDGVTQITYENAPKSLSGFKITADGKITTVKSLQNYEVSVSGEYSHTSAKAKLTFLDNPFVIKGSFTAGKPEYGVGFEGKFDLASQRLTGYNMALWLTQKHQKLVFKHVGTNPNEYELGNLEVSYYQKVSPLAHFGSKVTANLTNGNTDIEFGGDYKYDDSTLLKGKLNTDGKLGLAFQRALSKTLSVTIASEVDTRSIAANKLYDNKVGIRFDFTQ